MMSSASLCMCVFFCKLWFLSGWFFSPHILGIQKCIFADKCKLINYASQYRFFSVFVSFRLTRNKEGCIDVCVLQNSSWFNIWCCHDCNLYLNFIEDMCLGRRVRNWLFYRLFSGGNVNVKEEELTEVNTFSHITLRSQWHSNNASCNRLLEETIS